MLFDDKSRLSSITFHFPYVFLISCVKSVLFVQCMTSGNPNMAQYVCSYLLVLRILLNIISGCMRYIANYLCACTLITFNLFTDFKQQKEKNLSLYDNRRNSKRRHQISCVLSCQFNGDSVK
jgi:hypothetical protein